MLGEKELAELADQVTQLGTSAQAMTQDLVKNVGGSTQEVLKNVSGTVQSLFGFRSPKMSAGPSSPPPKENEPKVQSKELTKTPSSKAQINAARKWLADAEDTITASNASLGGGTKGAIDGMVDGTKVDSVKVKELGTAAQDMVKNLSGSVQSIFGVKKTTHEPPPSPKSPRKAPQDLQATTATPTSTQDIMKNLGGSIQSVFGVNNPTREPLPAPMSPRKASQELQATLANARAIFSAARPKK
jgi:hypothetical protein